MTAQKSIAPATGGVQYVVTDAFGNLVMLDTANPPQALSGPAVFQPATKTISLGFGSYGNAIVLTQQNVIDLLVPLTGFANTGILS